MKLFNELRQRWSSKGRPFRGKPRAASIRRLELPNGAWWDIETRPTVRQFERIQTVMQDGAEEQAAYEVLAYLTDAWSWPEDVNVDAIMDRRIDELIEAMQVFTLDIVPFLERVPARLKPNGSSTT